jgi:ATP-binding cassette subfamily F protein 3
MSLLQIEQLTKSYGADLLFSPFSAHVAPGDRIALIGDNGVGKSTLLRILAGLERPTEGVARRIGSARVGFLPQTARLEDEGTVRQALERPFAKLRAIEHEMRDLEERLATSGDETVLHRYDDLLHRFEREGGYEIDATIRAAFAGVGFSEADADKPVEVLSGGEEARAALARVLLEAPDLLLLDEPTNHLDFEALDWLEERLLSFEGALLLVSHDRHLLERVANRTWEIAFGQVTTYRVGYQASRDLRESSRERLLEAFEEQEETIEKYKDFIRRHKMGQKHRQAKDREKKLERIEENRIERPRDAKRIRLHIRSGDPSGKRVLSTHDLVVGFECPLLDLPDLELYRGERVAIIGPNGCGKTTLLRTVLGELPPLTGEVRIGHGVRPAVYRQNQEGLHGEASVLDAILSRSALTIGEARGLLGSFLFSGDDVEKKTKGLSGGERSRVALALLSLIEGNLLILDEPTNHLDLASQEILEQALLDYDGTVLLVSHDRALLETVATQIWLVEGSRLIVHTYGYKEYRRRLGEARAVRARDAGLTRQERSPAASAEVAATPSGAESGRKPDKYAVRRLEETRSALEAAIEGLEARIRQLEEDLAAASQNSDTEAIAALGAEHKTATLELRAKIAEWESLPALPE